MTSASRQLGPWSATALVIGSMIGSGVFLLPASLAPFGAASLAGWAVTLGGAVLLALTFAELSARWPQAGGPYAYARNAFGEAAGFAVAWSYWISIWCGNAAIAVTFAGSVAALVPSAAATPPRAAIVALAALWTCGAINLAGVREAGRVQVLTTALKLLPLFVFGAVALWFVDAARWTPLDETGLSLPRAAHATAALTLWALLGLESATVPASSIRDAARVVPRATVLGTLAAGLATILACTVVLLLVPAETLEESQAPMADAARGLWGPWAGRSMGLVAAVSCFGALNGWMLLSAQLSCAAARDRVFPAFFARVDSRGTPRAGVVVSSALASALVLANYTRPLVAVFTFAILLSTAATLLPYVASSAAWLLRGTGPSRVVAAGALCFGLYALSGIGGEAQAWGALLVLAGAPVYLVQDRLRRR